MSDHLVESGPIAIEELSDGVKYTLPVTSGLGKAMALPGLVFGAFFAGFAIFWIARASQSMWDKDGHFQWPGLFFPLFGLPFVLIGLGMMYWSLWESFSRQRVRLSNGQLAAARQLGALGRWHARSAQSIRELVVEPLAPRRAAEAMMAAMAGGDLRQLVARGETQPLVLAVGPKLDLEWLTADLLNRMALTTPTRLRDKLQVRTVEPPPKAPTGPTALPQMPLDRPAESQITLERTDDGLSLIVTPGGWKATHGLGWFSILWLGFMAFFSVPWFSADSPWFVYGFIALFWLIGFSLAAKALSMAKSQAFIDLVGDTLLITRKGLRKVRQHRFPLAELTDIRVGPSGMSQNDVPILELQIVPRTGKKLGLFMGRDEAELAWMADALKRAVIERGWTPVPR